MVHIYIYILNQMIIQHIILYDMKYVELDTLFVVNNHLLSSPIWTGVLTVRPVLDSTYKPITV